MAGGTRLSVGGGIRTGESVTDRYRTLEPDRCDVVLTGGKPAEALRILHAAGIS